MSETVEHPDNTDMYVDFSRQRHGRAEHLIFDQQTSPISARCRIIHDCPAVREGVVHDQRLPLGARPASNHMRSIGHRVVPIGKHGRCETRSVRGLRDDYTKRMRGRSDGEAATHQRSRAPTWQQSARNN